MAYSEDHIALAAEYALGTLDAAERAGADAALDEAVADVVQTREGLLAAARLAGGFA